MRDDTEGECTFVCPECDESLEVNAAMMDLLLEKGCVVCGADLTEDAFSAPCAP